MTLMHNDLLSQTGSTIPTIHPEEVKCYFQGPYVVLDVREASERRKGFLHDSLHIPSGLLACRVSKHKQVVLTPWTSILVYSNDGWHGGLATYTLHQLGFRHAVNLEGGFHNWRRHALPIAMPRQA